MSHVECCSVEVARNLVDILSRLLDSDVTRDENIVSAELPQWQLNEISRDIHEVYKLGYNSGTWVHYNADCA